MSFEPDLALLALAMDRVIPPVDDLPGAGGMGLAEDVVARSRTDDRFFSALQTVLRALPAAFEDLDDDRKDAAIRAIEEGSPRDFGQWLDVVYTVYYMQPAVHRRLGWHGRPPQPDGNQMPPWDENVLANVRRRKPFWRRP
ncbi:MAG: hypothetical protein AAF637_16380 [Pseudomonadota bacterium]